MGTNQTLTYYNENAKSFTEGTVNHALFAQMDETDFKRVEEQMREDLEKYYRNFRV